MVEKPYVYPIDQLSRELIEQTKARTGQEDMPVNDFLMEYGLIDDPGKEGKCCLEAILLFTPHYRSRFHPRAGIRVYAVDGTEKTEIEEEDLKFKRFDSPLFEMLSKVFAYMPKVIGRSATLYSLFFKEMPEYPEEAWQEFIINAAIHRDYSIEGNEIEIWVFNDRIEIESPGRLYSGIQVQDLTNSTHVHSSRNPRLADIFLKAGYIREIGRGILKVRNIMDKSYLNPPEFTETEVGFKVTMQNSPVFDVGDKDWEEKIKKLDLNLNQKRILIVYRESSFSNSDYQQINHCDRDTAYRDILEIVEKGYLKREGKGRGLHYIPDIA